MELVTMHGVAPDGSKLTVTIDLDDMDCPAEHGIACCTLPIGHPGPWHVATTRDTIVHSWRHTTETPTCTCAWCKGFEPWRSRYAQCIQRGWMAASDAVAAGIAEYAPNSAWYNTRVCRSCGTDEEVTGRHTYAGSWWVNLECGHTQNDDEH